MQMFRDTKARNVSSCLQGDSRRVSPRTAAEICKRAHVAPTRRPGEVTREEAEKLHQAILATKIMAPPLDCIAPIGGRSDRARAARRGEGGLLRGDHASRRASIAAIRS